VLTDWLNERMKSKKLTILNGAAKDYDEYLKDSWFCVGVTEALEAPKRVAQLVENERNRRTERGQK